MEKRYQVFVSSTYNDLQKERKEIIQALLELDCIPAGMELFPAASEDQWSLIKNVIDDCDYYLVIIGGRYGSTNSNGVSYTEMEYKYALESDKPIIGFLHNAPGEIPTKYSEKSEKNKIKLEEFKELVKKKMCKYYESPSDLGSKVSRAIIKLIKQHPGIGWVRADELPSEDVNKEILSLRKQNDKLNKELDQLQSKIPEGVKELSQGRDLFTVIFSFKSFSDDLDFSGTKHTGKLKLTWDEIFYYISPLMINEARENSIINKMNTIANEKVADRIKKQFKPAKVSVVSVNHDSIKTIVIQLRALGLISRSEKARSVKDISLYWKLTPFGDNHMTKLRAIKK